MQGKILKCVIFEKPGISDSRKTDVAKAVHDLVYYCLEQGRGGNPINPIYDKSNFDDLLHTPMPIPVLQSHYDLQEKLRQRNGFPLLTGEEREAMKTLLFRHRPKDCTEAMWNRLLTRPHFAFSAQCTRDDLTGALNYWTREGEWPAFTTLVDVFVDAEEEPINIMRS